MSANLLRMKHSNILDLSYIFTINFIPSKAREEIEICIGVVGKQRDVPFLSFRPSTPPPPIPEELEA